MPHHSPFRQLLDPQRRAVLDQILAARRWPGATMMADDGGDGNGSDTNGGQGGGSGDTGTYNPPAPPAPSPADVARRQQAGAGEQPKGDDTPPAADLTDAEKVAELEAQIARLRRENGNRRTAAQKARDDARAEYAQELAVQLGLVKGDDKPDPEKLAADLRQAQQQTRQARVELAVHQRAAKAGADPLALLDSRTFLAGAADLDPSSDTFGADIEKAISSALADNPRLKVQGQAPGRGGADLNGGTGKDRGPRPEIDLNTALAGAMNGTPR